MSDYTDNERMQIAQKEYDQYNNGKPLKVGDPVKINNFTTVVGYVAEVNHKDFGEDSYVITDTKDPAKASKVTVLYQGSTEGIDWSNNVAIACQIFTDGITRHLSAPQLLSSAQTLQRALDDYPNAHFELYGQSLGAMDGQYALASVDPADKGTGMSVHVAMLFPGLKHAQYTLVS